jgi:hypothetical protein
MYGYISNKNKNNNNSKNTEIIKSHEKAQRRQDN